MHRVVAGNSPREEFFLFHFSLGLSLPLVGPRDVTIAGGAALEHGQAHQAVVGVGGEGDRRAGRGGGDTPSRPSLVHTAHLTFNDERAQEDPRFPCFLLFLYFVFLPLSSAEK